MRLNKFIANAGFCSRRKADALIEAGDVTVNGKPATMGMKVEGNEDIHIKGKALKVHHETVSIMLHKPAGCITSKSDPHHSQTVMKLLPKELQHLKPAGRLDKDSEGLLILSNDGEFIQKLTHPSHEHSKTYEIIVKGFPKPVHLKPLEEGTLELDGYKLRPMQFRMLGTLKGKTRIELILKEGRKRQIRRVMDALGFPVLYLRRTKMGRLTLGDLAKGDYRELTQNDIDDALASS